VANAVLKSTIRKEFGKGAARRVRRAGAIPAVMRSHSETPIHISLPGHDAYLALRHTNAVLEIDLDGKRTLTIAREVQRNPVTDVIEHVDLQIVVKGEKIEAEVPIRIEGEPTTGVAILDLQQVRVLAEATHVPEVIIVDVTGLEEGQLVRLSALDWPKGVEAVSEDDLSVVTITTPRSEEAQEEALIPETEDEEVPEE
jgi:large subunit ribosomal protein L25